MEKTKSILTTCSRRAPALTWALILLFVADVSATAAHATANNPRPKSASAKELPLGLRRARWRVLGTRPLGMYYYSPDSRGLQSIEKHASQITVLAPQCFWLDAEGFVHGEVPPDTLELSRRLNLPLMPLLINPGFDRAIASAVLRTPKAQERAVMYMAYLANRDNYVGWQLDLEFIAPADKDHYTRFAARAAARLHRDGRLLSVAVVPRFSDAYPGTNPSGEFRTGEWGAPYDFRALARVADFLTLMTYDHHNQSSPPGPMAGYEWMKAALDYAVKRVPRDKLLLGIPFYGREWAASNGKVVSRSLSFDDLSPLLGRSGIELQWDQRWRAPWFQFRDGVETRTVWFDDPRSFAEKLQLVRLYRLRGLAAWRLGSEDPQFWPLAEAFAKELAAKPPRASRTPPARPKNAQSQRARVRSR